MYGTFVLFFVSFLQVFVIRYLEDVVLNVKVLRPLQVLCKLRVFWIETLQKLGLILVGHIQLGWPVRQLVCLEHSVYQTVFKFDPFIIFFQLVKF